MWDVSNQSVDLENDFRAARSSTDRSSLRQRRISVEGCVVLFLLVDLIAFVAAGVLAQSIAAIIDPASFDASFDPMIVVYSATGLFVLFAHGLGAYRTERALDPGASVARLLMALGATFVYVAVLGVATGTTQSHSRIWFFGWMSLSFALLTALRLALLAHLDRRLERGAFVYRALSVGLFSEPLGADAVKAFSARKTQLVGQLRMRNFAELECLAHPIAVQEIDQIYIVAPWVDVPAILPKLANLRHLSAEIFVLPDDARVHALQLGVSTCGDRISLRGATRPLDDWALWAKRMQDVAVAGAALMFFLPAMIAIAIAIKLEGPGPVFFRQRRVGFNGRHFKLLKFRSMHARASDRNASRQTSRSDERVTRVGRFIRRTSLDELPQFLNVLKGDMSVVGPRPHALQTRANGVALADIVDEYAARHRVKPGLTGWAQVSGYRGQLDTDEKVRKRVEYDIAYIDNWSTWLDIKIILRTVGLLFRDPGAY
jgi:Undecaprenyl-phosphate glucose phosphotransferase